MEHASVGEHEMTLARLFTASPDRLWTAWTTPTEFAAWFGTPPFLTDPASVSMDVRVGGLWKSQMINEHDGSVLSFAGDYREIDPPHKLIMSFKDPEQTESSQVEIITVTFEEKAGGTLLTIHQKGSMPQDEYPKLVQGYSGFMERLAIFLK